MAIQIERQRQDARPVILRSWPRLSFHELWRRISGRNAALAYLTDQ